MMVPARVRVSFVAGRHSGHKASSGLRTMIDYSSCLSVSKKEIEYPEQHQIYIIPPTRKYRIVVLANQRFYCEPPPTALLRHQQQVVIPQHRAYSSQRRKMHDDVDKFRRVNFYVA